jgi:hypothetical protein
MAERWRNRNPGLAAPHAFEAWLASPARQLSVIGAQRLHYIVDDLPDALY